MQSKPDLRYPGFYAFRDWLLGPIREAQLVCESNQYDPKKHLRGLTGLLGGCLCLLLLRFLFIQSEQQNWFPFLEWLGCSQLQQLKDNHLGSLCFWAVGCLFCYALIPALLIRFVLRERLKDYGLRLPRGKETLPLLGLGLAVMAPLVFLASQSLGFLKVYPFYDPHWDGFPGWDFFLWESLYAMQFLALEFFFRGFLIHSTLPVMGAWSIPVMVMPYCMIHFQKPFPEALASIFAGLFLGWLGLKTRSVLPGFALHAGVAWAMDLMALYRKGYW